MHNCIGILQIQSHICTYLHIFAHICILLLPLIHPTPDSYCNMLHIMMVSALDVAILLKAITQAVITITWAFMTPSEILNVVHA